MRLGNFSTSTEIINPSSWQLFYFFFFFCPQPECKCWACCATFLYVELWKATFLIDTICWACSYIYVYVELWKGTLDAISFFFSVVALAKVATQRLQCTQQADLSCFLFHMTDFSSSCILHFLHWGTELRNVTNVVYIYIYIYLCKNIRRLGKAV